MPFASRISAAICIFSLGFQAHAIVSTKDNEQIKKDILRSTVQIYRQVVNQKGVDYYSPRYCSGVLLAQDVVITNNGCIHDLGQKIGEKQKLLVKVNFLNSSGKVLASIDMKSYTTNKDTQEAEGMVQQLSDSFSYVDEDKAKDTARKELVGEVMAKLLEILGGDPQQMGVVTSDQLTEAQQTYLNSLREKASPEAMAKADALMREFDQRAMDRADELAKSQLEALIASKFGGKSLDQIKYQIASNDIGVIRLSKSAPKGFAPATFGSMPVSTAGNPEINAWIAGNGRAEEDGKGPFLVGPVSITQQDRGLLVAKATMASICYGDAGGPLFIESNGRAVVVGILVGFGGPGIKPNSHGVDKCELGKTFTSVELSPQMGFLGSQKTQ